MFQSAEDRFYYNFVFEVRGYVKKKKKKKKQANFKKKKKNFLFLIKKKKKKKKTRKLFTKQGKLPEVKESRNDPLYIV